MKRMREWLWPATLILSALLATLVIFIDLGTLLQTIVVCWFLLVGPGMALVRFLQLNDTIAEITLGLALSIALDTLVSLVLVYTHYWYPQRGLIFLIVLTLAGGILQLVGPLRGWRASASPGRSRR